MSFSDDLFWGDVAGDHERDLRTAALTHGKVAVAAYWPFLAASYSEQDFENRLSLSLSRISSLVAPEVLDEVVSSLRSDYRLVTTAEKGGKPWEKDDDSDDDALKDESDKAKAQSEDETGTDNGSDDDDDAKGDDEGESDSDDDDDDDSKGNQPNFLKKKQRDKSHTDKSDKAKKESAQSHPGGVNPFSDDAEEDDSEGRDASGSDGSKRQSAHTAPTPDSDTGYEYDPAPEHVQRAMRRRFDGGGITAHDPQRPGHFLHGVGNWWDGPHEVKNNGDNSYSFTNPYNGESDRFDEHGYYSHSGEHVPWSRHSSYVPDPSNAGRYHYQDLESLPLNNGDLQGPDGFIEDLAVGEQRTPEAYARQTTPGTWSQGQGMPERPMPAGVARGYQPVAARFDKEGFLVESLVDPQLGAPLNANPYYFNDGSKGLVGDETFPTDPWGGNVPDRANEYGDVQPTVSSGSEEGQQDGKGYSRSLPGTEASWQPPNFNYEAAKDPTDNTDYKLGYDHGWAGKPPQLGRTLNYDQDVYLKGHAEGTKDANTHARQQSRNMWIPQKYQSLSHESSTDGKIVGNCPGCDKPLRKHTTAHGDEFHHLHNDHVRCFGDKTASKEDHVSNYVSWAHGEGHDPDKVSTLKKYEKQPGISRAHTNHIADQLYIGGGDQDWRKNATSHFYEDEADRITSRAPRHSAEPFPVGSVVHVNRYPEGRYHSVIGHSGDNTVHLAPYGHEDSGTRFPESREGITRIANQYIEHRGDSWVITQKGTGKVLSHHDSEEMAEKSFDAMMQSKHGAVGWGHDTENHGLWSFADALDFNAGSYGTHFDKEGFVVDAAEYQGRPDAFNPTGRGPDEFRARTWDAYSTTRPMQSDRDRNVNNPVLPAEPIRTRNIGPESGIPGQGRTTDKLDQSGDEDEED